MRLQSKILDEPMSDFYLEMMDIQQAEMYSVLVRPDNGNTLIDIRRNGTLPTIKVHGTGLTAWLAQLHAMTRLIHTTSPAITTRTMH